MVGKNNSIRIMTGTEKLKILEDFVSIEFPYKLYPSDFKLPDKGVIDNDCRGSEACKVCWLSALEYLYNRESGGK